MTVVRAGVRGAGALIIALLTVRAAATPVAANVLCAATALPAELPAQIVSKPLSVCVPAAAGSERSPPIEIAIPTQRRYQQLIVSLVAVHRVVLAPHLTLRRSRDGAVLGRWRARDFLNRGGTLTVRVSLPAEESAPLVLLIEADQSTPASTKDFSVSSPLADLTVLRWTDLHLNLSFAQSGRVEIRGR